MKTLFHFSGFGKEDEDPQVANSASAWRKTKSDQVALHKKLAEAARRTAQASEAWSAVAAHVDEMAPRQTPQTQTIFLCWSECERIFAYELRRYHEILDGKLVLAAKQACEKAQAMVMPHKATYSDIKKKMAKARSKKDEDVEELKSLEVDRERSAKRYCEALDKARGEAELELAQAEAFDASLSLMRKASSEQGLQEEMFPGAEIGLPTDVRHVSGSGQGRLTGNNLDLTKGLPNKNLNSTSATLLMEQAFPSRPASGPPPPQNNSVLKGGPPSQTLPRPPARPLPSLPTEEGHGVEKADQKRSSCSSVGTVTAEAVKPESNLKIETLLRGSVCAWALDSNCHPSGEGSMEEAQRQDPSVVRAEEGPTLPREGADSNMSAVPVYDFTGPENSGQWGCGRADGVAEAPATYEGIAPGVGGQGGDDARDWDRGSPNRSDRYADSGSETEAAEGEGCWAAYEADDGNVYFHHSGTGETTWIRPTGFDGMPEPSTRPSGQQ